MALKIQLRRGTATEWTTANPVLMQGEMGVETDTLKVKLGNGTTAWSSLPYFTQGVKGDTGPQGPQGIQGVQGNTGPVGPVGPANSLSVGTVTTGAAGSDAVVTIAGTAPNQTISFTIPQGIQGIQGVKGDQGVGVPSGGSTGQVVVKTVSGTAWKTPALTDSSDVEITSPVDKQVLSYESGKWKNKVASGGVTVSEPAPASPIDGDGWFYATDGTLFVRYNDGDSTQWVQPNAVLSSQIEQRYYSPNAIINGAFDIWQRGTSFSASGYTADRWTGDFVTGAGTVTQQAFTPGTAPVAGYEGTFFLRRSVTTGAQFSSLIHRIEDVRTFAGQTVTLSFWAKGTNPTGNFNVNLLQFFGTGGSAQVGVGDQPLTLTSSWARYTYTFVIPSVAGKTIGAGSYLWLSIYQAAANTSASTLDIWGVQLELGTSASPFRRNANSLQGELAACQRYYYRWTATNTSSFLGICSAYGTTQLHMTMNFPVTMRAIPSGTLEWSGNIAAFASITGGTLSSVVLNGDGMSPQSAAMTWTGTGYTNAVAVTLRANNTVGAYFGFSAEL